MSVSYRVYANLGKMLEYRKLVLVSGDATKLSGGETKILLGAETFNSILQRHQYVVIQARDAEDKDRHHPSDMNPETQKMETITLIVLLDMQSSYVENSQKVMSLMNKIPFHREEDRNKNLDILIIPYETPGSNITNKLDDYLSEGSSSSGYVRITLLHYNYFKSNVMHNVQVSPTVIMPRDEARSKLEELYSTKRAISRTRVSDPVCVWLGAEIGDTLKTEIASEASGIEPKYLLVRS
jgi:DNA-directed RNA polymerase subunit H (RpoH/RPB5)